MKESISKSISSIMAYFEFDKVAEIEETFFKETCDNEEDTLENVIKDFVLEELYIFAERCKDIKENFWTETKYSLHFDYIYDKENPFIELSYIPISYRNY